MQPDLSSSTPTRPSQLRRPSPRQRWIPARHSQSLPPLDRLIALAELYGLTPAALLAQHTTAVWLIAAIDRAEEAVIARLAALLDASDNGL